MVKSSSGLAGPLSWNETTHRHLLVRLARVSHDSRSTKHSVTSAPGTTTEALRRYEGQPRRFHFVAFTIIPTTKSANMMPLDKKAAFFDQLRSFGSDDEFDDTELAERNRWRQFFKAKPAAHSAIPAHEESAVVDLTQRQPRNPKPTPKKISAEPSPAPSGRARIIKGTPITSFPQKTRLGALTNASDPDISIVEDTPIPETTRPTQRGISRTLSASKLHSSFSVLGEDSPSPSMALKKRRREPTSKPRPKNQQIFKNLSFYYIPDNDISPVRRMRIAKAKEYGATWTRHITDATHIIVDQGLAFKDVEGTLEGANKTSAPEVVNEKYPIDCIQYKTILNPNQGIYKLKGQPTSEKDKPTSTAQSTASEPATSLKLKSPQRNPRKWDYVALSGTPERSQESPQANRVVAAPTPTDSQPVVLEFEKFISSTREVSNDCETHIVRTNEQVPGSAGVKGNAQTKPANMPDSPNKKDHEDELNECIALMQEFKDLPLDAEDDDVHSAMDTGGGASELEASGSDDERVNKRKRTLRKTRSGRKDVAFEDRFACHTAGAKDAKAGNPNERTIEVLQQMANYYDRMNDHWRTITYRKAISTLKRQDAKIATEEEAFRLPNVGLRLAQKIEEIVTTNRLKRLEYAQGNPMDRVLQLFMGIYGVGTSQAQQWIAQGHRTLDNLKSGAKLTPNQLIGIKHYDDLNTRMPRQEVEALGQIVKKTAQSIDLAVQLIIGGSYRRGAESSGDIDFIVTKPNTKSARDLRPFLDDLVRRLEANRFLVARLASSKVGSHDGSKWHGCCVLPKIRGFNEDSYRPVWRRIDFLLVPETEMGAALIYFTGNDIFNRSMRLLASKKGMRLNQRGLYKDVMRGPQRVKVTEGELVEGRDEKKIFDILGVQWREPHERWC